MKYKSAYLLMFIIIAIGVMLIKSINYIEYYQGWKKVSLIIVSIISFLCLISILIKMPQILKVIFKSEDN